MVPVTPPPGTNCADITKAWCATYKPGSGFTWGQNSSAQQQELCTVKNQSTGQYDSECCCGSIQPCENPAATGGNKSTEASCGFFCVNKAADSEGHYPPIPGVKTKSQCDQMGGEWVTGHSVDCNWECAGGQILDNAGNLIGKVAEAAANTLEAGADILEWLSKHWWVIVIVVGVILVCVLAGVFGSKKANKMRNKLGMDPLQPQVQPQPAYEMTDRLSGDTYGYGGYGQQATY